jgi:hypothetical protein
MVVGAVINAQCTMIRTLCINVAWCCGEPVSKLLRHFVMSILLHCPMPTVCPFPLLAGWVPRLPWLPRWLPFPQGPRTPSPHLPLQLYIYILEGWPCTDLNILLNKYFLLASLLAGRRPPCTVAENVLHQTYPLEYQIYSSQPKPDVVLGQCSMYLASSVETLGLAILSTLCTRERGSEFYSSISVDAKIMPFYLYSDKVYLISLKQ